MNANVIVRRVAAIPARTSSETWQSIVELLTEAGSPARVALNSITNIAAILISEEYTRDAPIVAKPVTGPRIRVYTVHGTEAIEAINDETSLYGGQLAQEGWQVSLPCGVDDLDDIRIALAAHPAVEVRDVDAGLAVEASAGAPTAGTNALFIDLEEMGRS